MSSETDLVRPTRKIRTRNERLAPGGGGINVARVLQRLSVPVEALYLAGGATGSVLDGLLEQIGLPRRSLPLDGDTRLSLTVHERSSGLEYRFVPEGPCASAAELAAMMQDVARCRSDWLVLSGSLPACAPDGLYAQMVAAAPSNGLRIALDSSGEELKQAVEGGGIHLVKPSRSELEFLVGKPLASREEMVRAALPFVTSGKVRQFVVTLGHEGALLVNDEGAWFLPALPIEVLSAVGAGDSFLGAMIAAVVNGAGWLDAFRHGTAAGAATASTPGADLCHLAEITALLPRVVQPQPVLV